MDLAQAAKPNLKDLTTENITDNVILTNSQGNDARLRYVLDRLVRHLHDFARETRLSQKEWMHGIEFLTATGQICTDVRQEFILLSDILGLSLLVDSIDHPKCLNSTEGTVLGPFHTHDANDAQNGALISHDPEGEPLLVVCSLRDTQGQPIVNAKIDVWETDSKGFYDVQYSDRGEPDSRAVLRSDENGSFYFKAIVPVPYPIPSDGPVGKLLAQLKRHCYRPSHMHFMFEKPGFDHLITSLYLRGDPYETSDAVFGVKESLIVDLGQVSQEQAATYNIAEGSRLLTYDFVLLTEEEVQREQHKRASAAMQALGRKMKFVDGLPVPDVD